MGMQENKEYVPIQRRYSYKDTVALLIVFITHTANSETRWLNKEPNAFGFGAKARIPS
jgi:hypothetical protein